MNASPHAALHYRRRLRVALVAIVTSAVIATLIATGAANPHPNLKFAYLICAAVGMFGLIQLVLAITSRPALVVGDPGSRRPEGAPREPLRPPD